MQFTVAPLKNTKKPTQLSQRHVDANAMFLLVSILQIPWILGIYTNHRSSRLFEFSKAPRKSVCILMVNLCSLQCVQRFAVRPSPQRPVLHANVIAGSAEFALAIDPDANDNPTAP